MAGYTKLDAKAEVVKSKKELAPVDAMTTLRGQPWADAESSDDEILGCEERKTPSAALRPRVVSVAKLTSASKSHTAITTREQAVRTGMQRPAESLKPVASSGPIKLPKTVPTMVRTDGRETRAESGSASLSWRRPTMINVATRLEALVKPATKMESTVPSSLSSATQSTEVVEPVTASTAVAEPGASTGSTAEAGSDAVAESTAGIEPTAAIGPAVLNDSSKVSADATALAEESTLTMDEPELIASAEPCSVKRVGTTDRAVGCSDGWNRI